MSDETKQFIFALQQAENIGGMIWHGKVPADIISSFNLDITEGVRGFWLLHIYVFIQPQYELIDPKTKGIIK